ncbi:MAG: hypothetical protein ACTHZ9_05920 [Leucobacter sp.]
MTNDPNANFDDEEHSEKTAPERGDADEAEPEESSAFDAASIDARYPEFRGVTMGEFEDILLDEDDPRNTAAKKLTSEVMKPMNDMISRTMASVMDGKLDGIMAPIRKQMSELASSAMPKVDYSSIMKSAGLDKTTQSFMKALGEATSARVSATGGFAPSTFAAARQAAGIADQLKSLPTVKMPDVSSSLKMPKMPTLAERYASIARPEALRVPDLSLPATRSNSVESWVESIGEFVEEENLELTALESIASSLSKINERDEAEAAERKQETGEAKKRERNMFWLTLVSAIMVGLTLLITGYGVFFSGQNTPAPEQPTPTVTSEPRPEPPSPAVADTEEPSAPATPSTDAPAQQPLTPHPHAGAAEQLE